MKISTLCFLVKDNQILLAMKKRGFGEGKWNGVGGKVNPGETIERNNQRQPVDRSQRQPKNLALGKNNRHRFGHGELELQLGFGHERSENEQQCEQRLLHDDLLVFARTPRSRGNERLSSLIWYIVINLYILQDFSLY